MLRENRRKTYIGVGVGLLLQTAGLLLLDKSQETWLIGALLIVVGFWPFTWGCMNCAAGKGHSKYLGLLGLSGIFGLILLVLLRDRRKGMG